MLRFFLIHVLGKRIFEVQSVKKEAKKDESSFQSRDFVCRGLNVSSPPPRLGQATASRHSQLYLQSPVESSNLDRFLIEMDRQWILVNDIDHRAYNCGRIAGYPVQKRFQPPFTQKKCRTVRCWHPFLIRFQVTNPIQISLWITYSPDLSNPNFR